MINLDASRRRLLSILGTALLVVPPVAAVQIRLPASTDSGPIPGPDSKAIADQARSGIDPRISEAHDLYLDHLAQVTSFLNL